MKTPPVIDVPASTTACASAKAFSLFNLQRPQVIANPRPYYGQLRGAGPCVWDPYLKSWLVSGYRLVHALLRDPRLSVVMNHGEHSARVAPPSMRIAFRYLDRHVSFVDAPDHTRIRRHLVADFHGELVAGMRESVDAIIASSLAGVRRAGRMDLMHDFADMLPTLVIQRLLGMQDLAPATLQRWSIVWGTVVGSFGHVPDHADALMDEVREMIAYVAQRVATHRACPGDDLASRLIDAMDHHGSLSEDELVANLMMLITAGRETTANMIGNGALALLEHAGAAAALRDEPALVPVAVEELLRFDSPTQFTARVVREACEFDGWRFEAGQNVVLMLAAANRDPDVFAEPDTLRFDRRGPRHLAFGHGPHFCLGAELARLEVECALHALLRDVSGLRLAGEPQWRMNGNLRGLDTLPVEFDAIDVRTAAAVLPSL